MNLAGEIGASVYRITKETLIPSHNKVAMVTITYSYLVVKVKSEKKGTYQ